jgi:hypothetical protein
MSEANSSIAQMLKHLSEGDSRLARRCQDDPDFYRTTVKMVETLEKFYGQMHDDSEALQSFERKLRRWIRTSPDAYIGFWGELHVAYWLSQRKISHRFVDETQQSQTPDLELKALRRKVYLEIKTLQENPYEWFASRVLEEIEVVLPNCGISVEKLRLIEGQEEALVAKAVQVIRENWLASPYSPVEYEGEEGEFSIVLPEEGKPMFSWPESRIRKDGTPWLESQLKTVLKDNIGQFGIGAPTFLVWVSFDKLLPDIKDHAAQVLKQYGSDLVDVAGVIVFDRFLQWGLTENPSYCKYERSRREGLFETICAFKDR